MWIFVQSLLIGLAIAAPVGPIGLLVIQRTLQRGVAIGLATGMGAALADTVYGALGAYGVSGVTQWLQSLRVPLAVGGAAFLLWLAWRSWHASAATQPATVRDGAGLLAALAGTFVLTLSNPATIFSFIAVFGTLGVTATATAPDASTPALMVLGVCLGSMLWWLLLCLTLGRMRRLLDARWLQRINRLSACLLVGFALWPLLSLTVAAR